jgi:hypothetical protein
MRSLVRGMAVGGAGLALGFLVLVGPGNAADEDPDAQVRPAVTKIADALAKDKNADVKKDAEVLKKWQIKFTMRLFKLRMSKGFGVGDKPGAIKPDGIERKVEALADEELDAIKTQLPKESAALEQAGYRMAAIASVAQAFTPEKDDPKEKKKTVKRWKDNAELLRDAALKFAEAAKAKDGAALQKAALQAQKSCVQCHDGYRSDDD